MELEATTEGGQDKWGRRYGASGMYALLSTLSALSIPIVAW